MMAVPNPAVTDAPREHIRLRLLNDMKSDKTVWDASHRLRIGRLGKCEIALDSATISRYHAEVLVTEQGWAVRDLGSTNGTFLNGTCVGRAEVPIKEGDIIQAGEVSLLVASIKDEPASSDGAQTVGLEVLAAVNCTWPELLGQENAPDITGSAAAIARLGRKLCAADAMETFLESTLWEIAELFDAQHGAFVLLDERSQKPAARAVFAMGDRTQADASCYTEIAQWAVHQGKTMLCRPLPAAAAGMAPPTPTSTMILAYLRANERKLGVLYLGRTAEQQPFEDQDLYRAEMVGLCLSDTIYSLSRESSRHRELLIQTLTTLTQLLHLKNTCSREYSDKAAEYALLIAEELGVSEEDRYFLKIGTPLRDLGNIGVPDSILEKPGPLTAAELFVLKSHVVKGVALLEAVPFLAPLVPMVRSHHERWDGAGYPDRTSGTQIPLLGRIIAVADALDAMTSPRPFRDARSFDEAFAEIQISAGSQFDPECVEALLRARPRIDEISWERRLLPQTYCWDQLRKISEEAVTGLRSQRVSQT